ncbi:MAG: DUF5906 domain-containing protein [Cyclobacteriaceae bacterium]
MGKDTKSPDYVRVGTQYFKNANCPNGEGKTIERLIPWSRQAIVDDHGRDYLKEIPKFTDFICRPSHLDYQRKYGEFYNCYHPLPFYPKQGDWPAIAVFLKHIFGEQYTLGLDYLTLLYVRPTQILPILVLVSSERNTGKSTFLEFLKAIFEDNMTLNSNENSRSQFNSDWATKSIIANEETLLRKREDSERLKSLSTSYRIKTESKGIDKREIPFFGKFILCSNNPDDLIYTDQEEIRYWVRDVPTIQEVDPNLLNKLIAEIPAFLFFLQDREICSAAKTRMWFSPDDLWTPALQRLKEGNISTVEKELRELIREELLTYNIAEICFTRKDLLNLLKDANVRSVITHQLKEILTKWGLQPRDNGSTYKQYFIDYTDGQPVQNSRTLSGRYYTFSRDQFAPNTSIS